MTEIQNPKLSVSNIHNMNSDVVSNFDIGYLELKPEVFLWNVRKNKI